MLGSFVISGRLPVHAAPVVPNAMCAQAVMPERLLDEPYVPAPMAVVDAILNLTCVGKFDTRIDLGCGDRCIVIRAAGRFDCCSIGVDLDPVRVAQATRGVCRSRLTR